MTETNPRIETRGHLFVLVVLIHTQAYEFANDIVEWVIRGDVFDACSEELAFGLMVEQKTESNIVRKSPEQENCNKNLKTY